MRKFFGKDLIIIFIVMAAFFLQHLLTFNLGINFEEGRDGNAYYLAMQGYRPYRDFEWVYGPLSFLIYPFIMKIFGVNLIVLRLSYILFASLVIPLTYFLSRKIMPPLWSCMSTFLAINFFDVPYYTYNHIFTVLGELGCLLMIIKGISSTRYINSFFWAGVFTAITLLTKPFFSGIILLFSILLFMVILKVKNWLSIKFTNSIVVYSGTIFLIIILFIFFYLGDAIKNFLLESVPLFSPDPSGGLYNVGDVRLKVVTTRLFQRFFDLFTLNKILNINSLEALKKFLVDWFDNFIFCLPFLILFIILCIYKISKNKHRIVQNIFNQHKKIILLFIIFSVLISAENLTVGHRMSRAFNIQVTFILFIFFFYLLSNIVSNKRKALVLYLTLILTVILGFLHFFRYPWSRNIKFREVLNLKRARGIKVTTAEKNLYDLLSNYLEKNLNQDDKIVVLGYHPQFIFLTGTKSVFEDKEYIFLELIYLERLAKKDKRLLTKFRLLENQIIGRMESEKPKIVLDIVRSGMEPFYDNRVGEYIRENYILEKIFGPAEIHGIKGTDKKINMSSTEKADLYLLIHK